MAAKMMALEFLLRDTYSEKQKNNRRVIQQLEA
jgi:hypothetical protein